MGVGTWSDEQSQFLRDLVGNGASFAVAVEEINARFNTNFTRNAAIGRAQRIGLCSVRPRVIRTEKPPRRQKVRIDAPRVAMVRPVRETIEVRCAEVEPLHLSLADLQPHHCRYPYGDLTITFCGHGAVEGISYCEPHRLLCTRGDDRRGWTAATAERYRLAIKKNTTPKTIALSEESWEGEAA